MAVNKDILKPNPQSELTDISDELKYIREDLSEGLEKLAGVQQKSQYFDPELTGAIKEIIEKAVEQLGKIVIQAPAITIDMKAVEKIALSISSQNENILKLIGELPKNSNDSQYQELLKSVVTMINSSNEFFSKEIKHFDYTESLNKLVEANKRPVIEYIKIERDNSERLKRVIPIYKT